MILYQNMATAKSQEIALCDFW